MGLYGKNTVHDLKANTFPQSSYHQTSMENWTTHDHIRWPEGSVHVAFYGRCICRFWDALDDYRASAPCVHYVRKTG